VSSLDRIWHARNKNDLIIEVWEALDCESVGRSEIAAIEKVVRSRFGEQAVESPMVVARQLADEGAVLRHAEIMQMYVERQAAAPYAARLQLPFDLSSFPAAENTISRLDAIRRRFESEDDRAGLRHLREAAIAAKQRLAEPRPPQPDAERREIAEWLSHWLATPELFESWLMLRKRSNEFNAAFRSRDES
jgi:hypothetical protein